MSIGPVARRLLRDAAYEQIRDAIIRGELEPGAAVRDGDLAERLGLSRAPVRDALARLGREGLVDTKPQSYTRVTPLVVGEVRDAAAVVRVMHELAARTAVPTLGDAAVDAMRRANARFARARRQRDLDAALTADDELHGVLVDAAGNRALAATVDRYTPLIRRLERRRFGSVPARRSVLLHQRLIDACAHRDTAAAVLVTTEIWRSLEELAEDDRES